MEKFALWMIVPDFAYLEVAHSMGFRHIVIDVEHGTFTNRDLDHFLGLAKALGIKVLAKVLSPAPEALQQVLDWGADSVIIPHILGLEHARAVTAAAKYPPLGIRSAAGGRHVGYGRITDEYIASQNRDRRCYVLIETAESLADIEAIMALDTVDGFFAGPFDLSLSRGRGAYGFGDEDRADLLRCAKAAQAAGKSWIMPAWTAAERRFAGDEGASLLVVASQVATIRSGIQSTLDSLRREAILT